MGSIGKEKLASVWEGGWNTASFSKSLICKEIHEPGNTEGFPSRVDRSRSEKPELMSSEVYVNIERTSYQVLMLIWSLETSSV